MYALDLDAADDELRQVYSFCLENTLLLLSPILPHFCEELFERMGKEGPILRQPWPEYRKDSLLSDEALVVVQVNGKLRSKFSIAAGSSKETIRETALADSKIQKHLEGKTVKKVIVIQKKQTLVNIVV